VWSPHLTWSPDLILWSHVWSPDFLFVYAVEATLPDEGIVLLAQAWTDHVQSRGSWGWWGFNENRVECIAALAAGALLPPAAVGAAVGTAVGAAVGTGKRAGEGGEGGGLKRVRKAAPAPVDVGASRSLSHTHTYIHTYIHTHTHTHTLFLYIYISHTHSLSHTHTLSLTSRVSSSGASGVGEAIPVVLPPSQVNLISQYQTLNPKP